MRRAIICLAVAMSLPAVIWQPRPARAATAELPVSAPAGATPLG